MLEITFLMPVCLVCAAELDSLDTAIWDSICCKPAKSYVYRLVAGFFIILLY